MALNQPGATIDDNQFVLPDNKTMYLVSNRGEPPGPFGVYRTTRNVGGTFDAAAKLFPAADNEVAVAVMADELLLLFSSDRSPSNGGTDIWSARRTTTSDGWGMPSHVDQLSGPLADYVSCISADGCDVYLTRETSGDGADMFWSRRPL